MNEPAPEDEVASLKTSHGNAVKHVGRCRRANESQESAMGRSDTGRQYAHGCGQESRRSGQVCTRQPGRTWPAAGAPHRAVGEAPGIQRAGRRLQSTDPALGALLEQTHAPRDPTQVNKRRGTGYRPAPCTGGLTTPAPEQRPGPGGWGGGEHVTCSQPR